MTSSTSSDVKLQRRHLLELFEQAPFFVASLRGPKHVFELVNAAYQQLVGHREVLGKAVRDALPDIDGQGFFELLDTVFSSGVPYIGHALKVMLQRIPGQASEERYVDVSYQPLKNAKGQVTGILATGNDVTELKLATIERERLIAVLKASNQSLDRFVYVASHDLKSPLRGIATTAQFIEDELGPESPASIREYLRLLQSRVTRMEALIDGILSYARAGEDEPQIPVRVESLIREAFELLEPGRRVEFAVGPNMPVLLTAAVPLQQVFMNLISNAIKHSRRDDVHVSVTASRSGDFYVFCVGDNGPGIAPEFHSRVWEMFQTLSSRDAVEGSGIGLSTVKKIVEARGARLPSSRALATALGSPSNGPRRRSSCPEPLH